MRYGHLKKVLLLLPSILLFVFFLSNDLVNVWIWSDFFQKGTSIVDGLKVGLYVLMPLLFFAAAIFVVQGVRFIYLLLVRKRQSLKGEAIVLVSIAVFPFLGIFIVNHIGDDKAILRSMKASFDKENVDVERISEWLRIVDSEGIDPLGEESTLPKEIKEKLRSLPIPDIFLYQSNQQRCLIIQDGTVFMDAGILISAHSPPPYNFRDDIDSFDVNEYAFVWIEND